MLNDLDYIKNVFEIKYAPYNWKKKHCQWDLSYEYGKARAKICTLSDPKLAEFHKILKEFFIATKDYHVGVQFYSTEAASLPLVIKGAQGHYFIAHIERSSLPASQYPLHVGDEVLSFDGRNVGELLHELRRDEIGSNNLHTDLALAEIVLTSRKGERGNEIPQGDAVLEVKAPGESKAHFVTVPWTYTPEYVRDFTSLTPNREYACFEPTIFNGRKKVQDFFDKQMIYGQWKPQTYVGEGLVCENRHSIGAKKSFLPELGQKIWSEKSDAPFHAYVFTSPQNFKIGYVRIPHYAGDEEEVEAFVKIIKKFQTETHALIIDQLNNPGGAVFYLYGLLSALTPNTMHTPHHRITLTQEEVYTAYSIKEALKGVTTTKEAKTILGDTLGGYPVSVETVDLMNDFCEFLIEQWSQGQLFTDETYLFGVNQIKPHPKVAYSKPILVLTNPLNFSAADFFPAILQDNKRGVILGTKTAGAGGFVFNHTFPNQTAIASFNLTGSIAYRKNRAPIENLGVTPDLHYEISPEDLQTNYAPYCEYILNTVEKLIQKKLKSGDTFAAKRLHGEIDDLYRTEYP